MSANPATGRGAVAGTFAIKNAHKVWWPEEGITKLDVAEHYARVGPRLLPWTADRPLTVERCPDGFRGRCFYQKSFGNGAKFGIRTRGIRARSANRTVDYPIGDDIPTVLNLVNLGALALHLMNCRASALDRPDWLAFDLDPHARFADAVRAAMVLRDTLDEVGLRGYPKTTGGKGLHVLVPLRPGPTHAEVQAAAQALAERMVAKAPDLVTQSFYKRERGGRVYLDIARNVFGATLVAPYSVRHRRHAPVSTPLEWKDVRPEIDPAALNVRTTPERLTSADPWQRFWSDLQILPATLATPAARGGRGALAVPRRSRAPGSGRPAPTLAGTFRAS